MRLTTGEQAICAETLARVRGRADIMRAEQHIVSVALGYWAEKTLYGQARQMQRLDEACAAYHQLLSEAAEQAR